MDELESRMRAANPFPQSTLTPEQRQRLLEIQRVPDRQPIRTLRKLPVFLSAAAVLVVATLIAVATFVYLQPTHAYAVTPPPLKATPVDGTTADLLRELSMELEGNHTPGTVVRFESWGLSVTVGEPLPSVVIPQEHTVEHLPDGSGSLLIQIGSPYTLNGEPAEDIEVGETVWEQQFGPGEFPSLFPVPPSASGDIGAYLREYGGLTDTATTGDYFTSVRSLLSERNLSSAEEAAVLEFLAHQPDITTLGAVTDRLGRDGLAFSTETRTGNPVRDILIVSTSGQGILAFEVTYLANDRLDIPAGAVIDYIAWK